MRKIEEPIVEIPTPQALRMLSQGQRQDILEASVMAIVSQGGPSMGMEGGCSYRGCDFRKCAVGHFIDDKLWKPELEGQTVDSWPIHNALEKSLQMSLGREDFEFFRDLQNCHDISAFDANDDDEFWSRWVSALRRMCDNYGLRFPEELV